jgi:hypothetical protein
MRCFCFQAFKSFITLYGPTTYSESTVCPMLSLPKARVFPSESTIARRSGPSDCTFAVGVRSWRKTVPVHR